MPEQTQGYTIYARKLRGEDRNSFNALGTYRSKGNRWIIFWDVDDRDRLPADAHKLYEPLKKAITELIRTSQDPNLEEVSLSLNIKHAQSRAKCIVYPEPRSCLMILRDDSGPEAV